jgi:hypothetical protein
VRSEANLSLELQAFSFRSSVKAKRLQAISAEKDQRRLHVPVIDRAAEEPPPYIVVVQGPPQVCSISCPVVFYMY